MSRIANRSRLLAWTALLFIALAASFISPTTLHADSTVVVNIGYQKGDYFTLLKAQGTLEKIFGAKNVTWVVFPAGPQLLEALNAGSVDFGATGETPPIFAQAAGTPLLYAGTDFGSGAGQAVIVPKDSPVKTAADLKGKKIAFNKASSAHLLTVRALQSAGLQYTDITPVFLAPADARAAFQGGSIDAWTIWDPYLTAAIQDLGARVVVDGKDLAKTRGYYEVRQAFAKDHPDITESVINELIKVSGWAHTHPDEYAQLLSTETGVPVDIWKTSITSDPRYVTFIDDQTIKDQQAVADIWFNLGLIPNKLTIKDVVWRPADYVPPTPQATDAATQVATASQ